MRTKNFNVLSVSKYSRFIPFYSFFNSTIISIFSYYLFDHFFVSIRLKSKFLHIYFEFSSRKKNVEY